jgi:hypothetical protein
LATSFSALVSSFFGAAFFLPSAFFGSVFSTGFSLIFSSPT